MKEVVLIGLDLGKKTGVAHNFNGKKICFTKNLKNGREEIEFYDFINSLLNEINPDAIVYEQVCRHMGTHAAHRWGGYQALLNLISQQRGIMLTMVGVTELKKFATNNGRAGKDMMVEASERYGYSPKDDNSADASMILEYALSFNLIEKIN